MRPVSAVIRLCGGDEVWLASNSASAVSLKELMTTCTKRFFDWQNARNKKDGKTWNINTKLAKGKRKNICITTLLI